MGLHASGSVKPSLAWMFALALAGATLAALVVAAPVVEPTLPPTGSGSPSSGASASSSIVPPSVLPPSPEPTLAPSPPATAAAVVTPGPTPSPAPTIRPTSKPSATPAPTPGPSRTPRPSPRPSPTPTVTPPPVGPASTAIRHGNRASNAVALTFDMGGRVGDALAIVRWLVEHETHATIFMTGAMAENTNTEAGRRVLAIVEEHSELFTLGNHSYTHRDFRTLSAAQIREELVRTEAAIAPYCSQDLRPFFRPPSGGYDAAVLAAVGAAGYRQSILWDVDTIDWRPIANDPPGPTAEQMVTKVLANARGGSIVLMHLGGYETFEALPAIVHGLLDRGFALENLEALL